MRIFAMLAIVGACGGRAHRNDAPASACGPPVAGTAAAPARQVVQRRHAQRVESLAFSDDGRYLATASNDGTTKVWDVGARALVRTLELGRRAAAHPDSDVIRFPFVAWDDANRLVAGNRDSGARLIEVGSERDFGGFDPPLASSPRRLRSTGGARWVGFTRDSVLTRYDDNRRRIGTIALRPAAFFPTSAWALTASFDGRTIAALDDDEILAWSSDGNAARIATPHNDRSDTLASFPAGDRFVVGSKSRDEVVVVSRDGSSSELPCHPCTVFDVAVSPDGELVAAATWHGIIVWNAKARTIRWQRTKPDVRGVPGGCSADSLLQVAFSPKGRALAATGGCGSILVFDRDTGRELATLGTALRVPSSIAFTAADELAVVSRPHVTTWSLATGRRLDERAIAIPDLIARRSIGERTYALRYPEGRERPPGERGFEVVPGDGSCPGGVKLVIDSWTTRNASRRAWPPPDLKTRSDCLPTPNGDYVTVTDLDFRPGRILYETFSSTSYAFENYSHAIGTSSTVRVPVPETSGIALADSGATIVGIVGNRIRIFESASVKLLEEVELPADDHDVRIRRIALDATNMLVGTSRWLYGYSRSTGKVRFRLQPPAEPSVIAAASGGFVVAGVDGSLSLVRDDRIQWTAGGRSSEIFDIAVGPDGRRAATISADGAVRIWDLDAGALLGTLLEFDDDEWIALTAGGSYTGTDEAAERVGWVFEAPLEYFRFEQFSALFRDAGAVARRFGEGIPEATAPVRRPPHVELVGEPPREVRGSSTTVSLRVRSDTRVDAVRVYAEGRPVAEAKVCKASAELAITIPLTTANNRLSVIAVDDRGYASNPAVTDVVATAAAKPDLWIVAIGVDRYPQLASQWQLTAAAADARAIAAAFTSQVGPDKPFAHAKTVTLLDERVTVDSVGNALDQLAQMKPEDVAVVFLAGHGWKPNDASDMVFLTGAVTSDLTKLAGTAVGWNEIGMRLRKARGRVVVLLDACHAGHVSQDLIVPNGQLAAALHQSGRAGVLVFAASKGRQLSYEVHGARAIKLVPDTRRHIVADAQHGIFTAAVLGALDDRATDRDGNGMIELGELVDSVTARVTVVSDGQQTPWVARREMFGDFGIARAR